MDDITLYRKSELITRMFGHRKILIGSEKSKLGEIGYFTGRTIDILVYSCQTSANGVKIFFKKRHMFSRKPDYELVYGKGLEGAVESTESRNWMPIFEELYKHALAKSRTIEKLNQFARKGALNTSPN